MTESHPLDLRKTVGNGKQGICIGKPDPVHPAAADRNRGMMQEEHHMPLAVDCQRALEAGKFGPGKHAL